MLRDNLAQRRLLHALFGIAAFICLVAAAIFLNRHRLWFPCLSTETLRDVRHERGYAYIAPTDRIELSGQEHPSLGMVLENGAPLPGPSGALHDDIRNRGMGQYSFWGENVYFSSSDNSVPGLNGRSYQIRFPWMVKRPLAMASYACALFTIGAVGWFAACKRERRAMSRSVLSAYVAPAFYVLAGLSATFWLLLACVYLNRHAIFQISWPANVLMGIQPELGFAKSFLSRGMAVSGLLLSLGALALGILNLFHVDPSPGLRKLSDFAGSFLRSERTLIHLALLLCAGCVIWFRLFPARFPPRDLESIIVEEQIKRAATIKSADVLVVGDSSALMGVDAVMLGRLLHGRSVENLSTLGWVGPKGYAHLIEMYFGRGNSAKALVLLMHGISINRPETQWNNWEEMVLDERLPGASESNPLFEFRSELNSALLGWILAPPMPGAWGRYYGTQFELAGAIEKQHGSIYQPLLEMPAESGRWDMSIEPKGEDVTNRMPSDSLYQLSPTASLGLRQFAEMASRFKVEHVLFGITPTYLSSMTRRAIAENGQVANEIGYLMRQSLGRRFVLLELEPFRADEYFASNTHMNSLGREHFTRDLATILSPMVQ
jgi:hypothetical protein